MARLIDFDAARAERTHEPLTLRAYGKTFELPEKMPAGLYLDILRMEADKGGGSDMSDKDAIMLMRRVIPPVVLDELLAEPEFNLDHLEMLTHMVMQAYQGEPVVPLAEPTPNRAARRHPPKSAPLASPASSKPRKPKALPGATS